MIKLIPLLLTLWFLITAAHAGTVYKSIDKDGKVTYSEKPIEDPSDVSRIKLAPPPSEEHIEAAKQRYESNQKTAEIIDETRKKQDAQAEKEYRIRQERQQQLRQKQQAEDINRNDQYGYYPYGRGGTGIIINPGRPIVRPPINLPVQPAPGPRPILR